MVKGLVRSVPTSAAIQCAYVCLQVQALNSASTACLLQPAFLFAIDRHYFSFSDSFELQQAGHHETLHLRSSKLHTENLFSANTAKYWGIAG